MLMQPPHVSTYTHYGTMFAWLRGHSAACLNTCAVQYEVSGASEATLTVAEASNVCLSVFLSVTNLIVFRVTDRAGVLTSLPNLSDLPLVWCQQTVTMLNRNQA